MTDLERVARAIMAADHGIYIDASAMAKIAQAALDAMAPERAVVEAAEALNADRGPVEIYRRYRTGFRLHDALAALRRAREERG